MMLLAGESKLESSDVNQDGEESDRAKSGSTTDVEEAEKSVEKRPRLTSIRLQEENEKQTNILAGVVIVFLI